MEPANFQKKILKDHLIWDAEFGIGKSLNVYNALINGTLMRKDNAHQYLTIVKDLAVRLEDVLIVIEGMILFEANV